MNISDFLTLLNSFSSIFSKQTAKNFTCLMVGWVLCATRRTITGMLPYADPDGRKAHDAYHRFFHAAAWSMSKLYKQLAKMLVKNLTTGDGRISLVIDDSVIKKTGRKIDGAKENRDAVRSTKSKVAYAWGLQFVPLCLNIPSPFGGEPLALPMNCRLKRKGGATLPELVIEMLIEVASWLPNKEFILTGDGAYACLAGKLLPRTIVVSRMRRDAALYELPPAHKPGQRGRPRKKGKRLPTPTELAKKIKKCDWQKISVDCRGKMRDYLVYCERVLWYHVCPDKQVKLVIVRDPSGVQRDDFFFTTDLEMPAEKVVFEYNNRWSVEDTFRNIKQYLGAEEPQSWKGAAPEYICGLSNFLYSLIWLWYIKCGWKPGSIKSTPWYPSKSKPSFIDAISCLREELWRCRIKSTLAKGRELRNILCMLVSLLSRAM
jgi:hypothetical protein